MSFTETVREHFVPSKENSYRPHLLRKPWLMFFIAVMFVSEATFASSLFVSQSGAAPQSAQVASVAGIPGAAQFNSTMQSFGRQLARATVDARPAVPWILGLVALLLIAALFFTFFVHIQIQQPEMLFSGALVAMFALTLIVTNIQIAGML